MTFDPNDFQDQAAIAAMLQRQRMINSQNQQQKIPKNRQCPWCGGLLPGQYSKCQHCSSDVSWVDGLPCKPQDADYRRREIAQNRQNQKKRNADIVARVVNCKICGSNVPQRDLESTIKICNKCKRIVKNAPVILIIAVLILLIILGIFGDF
jgi:hypothetical protein